jgi:hypothetical protein
MLKSAFSVVILLLQFHPGFAIAQVNEPLFFEPSTFSTRYSDYYSRISNVLSRYGSPISEAIVETVCIPSFEPAWSFQIYHPLYDFVGEHGQREYHEDTVQFIVQYERAKEVIGIANITRDIRNKTLVKSRQIPGTSAKDIEEAFAATLALARWPTGRDLFSMDGTQYHFIVHSRATDAHMWAQSISPRNGTRAKLLADLSELVGKFVLAGDESEAGQTLIDIHTLCVELKR